MIQIKKTPMDLIDDIYSLAYWMTGSENASEKLVSCTYLNTDLHAPETDVIKAFRECYIDNYGQQADLSVFEPAGSVKGIFDSFRAWAADIKLSVLLSDMTGLKHVEIAEVIGKPVETIRLWLFWGRKFMLNDHLMKASA